MIKQSIAGAISEYLDNVTAHKSESSQRQEKVYFKDLEDYFLKLKIELINEIQPKHIDFFQSSLLKKKLPQTVNRQFTLYNHFFKKHVEWGYIEYSPTRFCKKKREIDPERELWELWEVQAILDDTSGWFHYAFKILFLTGMRPAELKLLEVSDVFLKEGLFRLYCEKNAKGFRWLPFNDEVRSCLLEFMPKDGLLLTSNKGYPISTDTLNGQLERTQRKLKMKRKTIYSLRHSYATALCKSNLNINKIRAVLGHSNIKTTLKYLQTDVEDLREVVLKKTV